MYNYAWWGRTLQFRKKPAVLHHTAGKYEQNPFKARRKMRYTYLGLQVWSVCPGDRRLYVAWKPQQAQTNLSLWHMNSIHQKSWNDQKALILNYMVYEKCFSFNIFCDIMCEGSRKYLDKLYWTEEIANRPCQLALDFMSYTAILTFSWDWWKRIYGSLGVEHVL